MIAFGPDLLRARRRAELGVTADRDQAWRDFRGRRVNHDATLLGLAEFTMAPYAPWTADRSPVLGKVRGGH